MTDRVNVSSSATMRGPQASQGAALVSVLFILVAVLMLGFSTLFLTQTNLRAAGNVAAGSVAENNAVSGLSAAFVVLERHYEENGELPLTLGSLPEISGKNYTPDFRISVDDYGYERLSPDMARVSVTGYGPNNAEFKSEAVVAVNIDTQMPPYFNYGLSSEGLIEASGNAAYLNAGIHGNRGFDLSGNQNFYVCLSRNSDGVCTREEKVESSSTPATASPGATVCEVPNKLSDYNLCDGDVPAHLIDPVEIESNFADKRDRALAEVSKGPDSPSAFGINCDVLLDSAPPKEVFGAYSSGETICVEHGGLNYSGGWDISNINIVVRGSVTLSGNVEINDVNLFILDGSFTSSGNLSNLDNFRIFAENDIDLSGNLNGFSTLAAGRDINVSGNADGLRNGHRTAISVGMIADRNITLSGNTRLFVAAVAGGTFSKSGNAELYGSIASKGTLKVSGNFHLDAGFDIENEDLKEDSLVTVRAVSRR